MAQTSKMKIRLLMCLVGCLMAFSAMALPANTFANHSRLASGKWVKIAIPQDGVYQITASELQEMGFGDINQVAVYGNGGHLMSELLNGRAVDDLQPVSAQVIEDKLCFYAKGTVKFEYDGTCFMRTLNTYSSQGYYFLTEESNPARISTLPMSEVSSQEGGRLRSTGYGYFYDEQELMSVTNSGKDLLNCDIPSSGVNVDFTLPHVVSPYLTACVKVGAGLSSNGSNACGYVSADVVVGGTRKTITFNTSTSYIKTKGNNVTYEDATAVGEVTMSAVMQNGVLRVNRPTLSNAKHSSSYYDYAIITYERDNTIDGESNAQTRMTIANVVAGDTIGVEGNEYLHVWNISGEQPVELETEIRGNMVMAMPNMEADVADFVAFDPGKDLLSIVGYEEVANQDLHSMEVPDMLIIAHPELLSEAERLADLHRKNDGLDVVIITQDQIFNEFSSGTPDAMAVRLLCKMLYDRVPKKFKHLLFMGQALFDHRNILSSKPCQVITYESDNSGDGNTSYGGDDFFGTLDDNSGGTLGKDYLRLGVGRITSANSREAKADVDKIYKYVNEPDYGVWRNNVFLSADEGDSDKHIFQAEGIGEIINKTHNMGMPISKAYIPMFGKAVNEQAKDYAERTCPEAERFMYESLDAGQYFATYVGHASQSQFTKKSHLWTMNDAKNSSYEHWPIFTTACCSATHFDSGTRGIAEHMFHHTNGGAIAVLASTREVYGDKNDLLNRAFVNSLFTAGASGEMPTLGEVYMKSKQSFGNEVNYNKLMFMLLGDPAMKLNYPRPLMTVTSINGEDVSGGQSITASPLQQLTVEAKVKNANGSLDDSFSGNAFLTIYSPQRFLRNVTAFNGRVMTTRSIYYPRVVLTQVEGKVVNGVFTAQAVLPRDILASDQGDMLVSVYAHKEGTDQMVNGTYDKLAVGPYDEELAITDDQAPVIENIYLDNADAYASNDLVSAEPVLHVEVSDDVAINSTETAVTGGMTLTLDGGKDTYNEIKNSATFTDNGRRMTLNFPVKGLTFGEHTLTFQVQDMAGHSATSTLSFVIGQTKTLELNALENVVTRQVTFDVGRSTLPSVPELTLKVLDVAGNLVWTTTTSAFPCSWDLKGINGERVPNGVYRYFGTFDTNEYYGGTTPAEIIVIEP